MHPTQSALGQAQQNTMRLNGGKQQPMGKQPANLFGSSQDSSMQQPPQAMHIPASNAQVSPFNQHFQNPQVQQSLYQIGNYLGSIGHPLSSAFNQFHNLGQPRGQSQGQQPQGSQHQQPQVAPRAPQNTQQQIMAQITQGQSNPLLRGSFGGYGATGH